MRLFFIFGIIGCASSQKQNQDTNSAQIQVDNDNDGYSTDEDCDDSDPDSNPGADEICDGQDNNCDGVIDEEVTSTYYADSDNDGYGNSEITTEACEVQDGFVENGSDCDDTNENSYPSAAELCDGLDNDCDEEIDEELDVDFYVDADDDGFGDDNNIVSGCSPEMGLSTIGGDCDDSEASISPLANEICDEVDNNCNGEIDEGVTTTFFADNDGDSYGDPNQTTESCELLVGHVSNDMDCNDSESAVNPSALESCDSIDNDCDGEIDEEGAIDGSVWYEDGDEDSFGDANSTLVACSQPEGYVSNSTDCDDNISLFFPGAQERCNGFDDNCDGVIDEDGAVNATTWFADHDGDGFGNLNETLSSCEQPLGYTSDSSDCDDNDDDTFPGASEVCDEEDNDCDGTTDESDSADAQTWFIDGDGDGFGTPSLSETGCLQPSNGVLNSEDCDDANSDVSPDAAEQCDSIDNDCDGNIDENDAIDQTAWYEDGDGDGFGLMSSVIVACDAPFGHVANGTDCDDADSMINPDAEEVCDNSDNNCDGITDGDEATDATTWYVDYDGDNHGSNTITLVSCVQPANFVSNSDDCDDTNAVIFSSNTEICDGFDNDCNGTVDDSTDLTFTDWYLDNDSDNYGDPNTSINACSQPSGYVEDNTDCNDFDSSISPAGTEVCDDVDNNCSGTIDDATLLTYSDWYMDFDNDTYGNPNDSVSSCSQPTGYVSDNTDCNDTESTISPAGTELCDDIDNDCNGTVDDSTLLTYNDWYMDYDNDTYGDPNVSVNACSQPSGYVLDNADCDDTESTISPDGTEICDDIDNDCNGTIDDETVLTYTTWYEDNDGDQYGDSSSSVSACSQPTGYVSDNTDCDDTNSTVSPLTGCGGSCKSLYDQGYTSDGSYTIDPDGYNTGEDPIEVHCDMTTDGGGWTLCASLTKGYVPVYMLHDEDLYAFQARLNSSNDYVYEREAPARSTATWDSSEDLNYGQFCRHMGTDIEKTRIVSKMYDYSNAYGANVKGANYAGTKGGVYSGNLFLQWFTGNGNARTFTHLSGDQLYIQLNNGSSYVGTNNSGYIVPTVSWGGSGNGAPPYTHTINPWYATGSCSGCTGGDSGYSTLPYGQTTILNNLSHSFWTGIPKAEYGWSDCTYSGNCNYHESGMGVWLFYVR